MREAICITTKQKQCASKLYNHHGSEVYLAVKFPPKPVIYTQESTSQPCNQSWNQNISFITERNLLSSPQPVILRANATDLQAGCQSDQRWNMG